MSKNKACKVYKKKIVIHNEITGNSLVGIVKVTMNYKKMYIGISEVLIHVSKIESWINGNLFKCYDNIETENYVLKLTEEHIKLITDELTHLTSLPKVLTFDEKMELLMK